LDQMEYRPVELHELLAFGEQYPDIQRKFLIVALGSVWWSPRGDRCVPYLYTDVEHRRHLALHCAEGVWFSNYWFVVCRK
ncbi:MAG: hypothetical protein QME57_03890, partial [Patescibacteria group bacterium]|nr:hypothetical protein [Patescibacteria group bacterium]